MNREKVMTFMKKSLRFLPDKAYIKLYYRLRVGRKLNMHDPETLNEKLQWLKFNYRFPLQSIVSDKLLVRDYVKEKIGEEYLIPLLGSWEEYSDIDFSSLPKRFVLKCNHDSGGLVVCTDKDKLNYEEAKKKIEKSLKSNFFYIGREYQYRNIKPMILMMEMFRWIIRFIALMVSRMSYWFAKTDLAKIHTKHLIYTMTKNGISFH